METQEQIELKRKYAEALMELTNRFIKSLHNQKWGLDSNLRARFEFNSINIGLQIPGKNLYYLNTISEIRINPDVNTNYGKQDPYLSTSSHIISFDYKKDDLHLHKFRVDTLKILMDNIDVAMPISKKFVVEYNELYNNYINSSNKLKLIK